jgi:hypothetical protein
MWARSERKGYVYNSLESLLKVMTKAILELVITKSLS